MYRQSHSRLQCTPSIDFVTFSNVRGVAAVINEDEQFMVNHADIKAYFYNHVLTERRNNNNWRKVHSQLPKFKFTTITVP